MLDISVVFREAMQNQEGTLNEEALSKYLIKLEQDNVKKSRTIKANSDEEAFNKIYYGLCGYTDTANSIEDIKREFANADSSDGRPYILTIKNSDGQMLYESPFLLRQWFNDILELIHENIQLAEFRAETIEEYKDDQNNPAVFGRKSYDHYVRELEELQRRVSKYEDMLKQKFPYKPPFKLRHSWEKDIIDNIYGKD